MFIIETSTRIHDVYVVNKKRAFFIEEGTLVQYFPLVSMWSSNNVRYNCVLYLFLGYQEVNPNVTFKTEVKEEEPMDVDDDSESIATRTTPSNVSLSDKQACFILFSKFTKEVLIRLKQYKDDLLASCLFLILSLPHQVVENQVHDVIPALKVISSPPP